MNSNGHTLIRRPIPLLAVELSEYSIVRRLDRQYLIHRSLSLQPALGIRKMWCKKVINSICSSYNNEMVPYFLLDGVELFVYEFYERIGKSIDQTF